MGSGNKHAAKNDVLIKKLHHDQSLVFVKIQNFGNRSGVAFGLSDQRVILEIRPVEWQRPAFTYQANIRKRLFDNRRTLRTPHQKNKIEVAVANLLHLPLIGNTTEAFRQGLQPAKA